MSELYAAARQGRLPVCFRPQTSGLRVRAGPSTRTATSCPSIGSGNPLGYTEYFLQHSDGTYSLLHSRDEAFRPTQASS
jgi:hypothetical protein